MKSHSNQKAVAEADLILISKLFMTQKAVEFIKNANSLNHNRIYLCIYETSRSQLPSDYH